MLSAFKCHLCSLIKVFTVVALFYKGAAIKLRPHDKQEENTAAEIHATQGYLASQKNIVKAAADEQLCRNAVLHAYTDQVPAEPRISELKFCKAWDKIESCCNLASDAEMRDFFKSIESRAAKIVEAKPLRKLNVESNLMSINQALSDANLTNEDKEKLETQADAWKELEDMEYRIRGVFQGTYFINCANSVIGYYKQLACSSCSPKFKFWYMKQANEIKGASAFTQLKANEMSPRVEEGYWLEVQKDTCETLYQKCEPFMRVFNKGAALLQNNTVEARLLEAQKMQLLPTGKT
eukprot:Platyproteum_vivax@DN7327_c0_g1_i6.p1